MSRMGRLTAIGLVAAAAGAGVGIWLGVADSGSSNSAAKTPPYQHFRTRPDLKPPVVTILHSAGATAPGYVFLAPKKAVAQDGPLILDNRGQVVWFDPLPAKGVADFKLQRYKGKPVLTWWQGTVAKGGHALAGGYRIMDSSYRVIKFVQAGNGLTGDIHDFQLTPSGTALMTIYDKVPMNLASVGGPKQGYVLEGSIQEVSLATGKVLFEWHSVKHVAPTESYLPLGKKGGELKSPYDYFHINSVGLDDDGNLLVSARHTSTVYKIRKSDGTILWRLGGKKSNFTFGPGAKFAWQHDARRQPDGTITLFDNAAQAEQKGVESQALVLRLDAAARRVTLVRAYTHKPALLSTSQGDNQPLPNGNVFVGWGGLPYFTEYSADGKVLLDGTFGGDDDSYRAFRFPWVGRPTTKPAVAVDGKTVYVSWNGATQVASWQVVGGADAKHLQPVGSAARNGFETAIRLSTKPHVVAVQALASDGSVLATSPVVSS
jgi:Arylsulfotransferase (ASST)